MKSKRDSNNENETRVELKYCERCGGLWLRECGSGIIYCGTCQADVAELPIPKKPQRLKLPMPRRAAIPGYEFDACAGHGSRLQRGGVA